MAELVKAKLTDFLQEKKASANCMSCGANKWSVPEDDIATLRLPIVQKGGNISVPGPAIPAYVMICGNCGFMRMHAVAMVDPEAMKGIA